MGKVGELWIELSTRLDKFNRGMSDAERSMVKVGKRFTAIGKKMTMLVTLPILALGAAAVKVGADFEQSITNAFAVTGAESEKVKAKMEALARTMGEKTVFSAKEAADAMYWMASAGWKIEQMTDALEPTLALAAATQSELAFATETVITTLKQYGLQASDAGRVSNVFAAAISNSQATLDRLKESLKYIGPMADAMGWSIEDTTAILSEFYDIGIDASMAGTALRMAFSQLAAGTPKTQKALKELGLTMADVNPETKSLGEIIETLSSKTMTLEQAIKIFGVRAGPNMLKVLRLGSEAFTNFRDKITDTQAAAEMMRKQLDTLSGQWKILKSKLMEAAISISKVLIPVLRELIDKHLKPAVDWFNNLSDGTKKTIVKFAGLVAIAGPLLLVFGKLMIILPGLKLALAALTGPIGLAVTAFILITAKVIEAKVAYEDFSKTIKDYSDASGKSLSGLEEKTYGLEGAFLKLLKSTPVGTILKFTGVTKKLKEEQIRLREETKKLTKEKIEYGKKIFEAIKKTEAFKDVSKSLGGILKSLGLKTKDAKGKTEGLALAAKDLFKQFSEGKITFEEYLKKVEELKSSHEEKLNPALKTTIALLKYTITPAMELYRQFAEGKISSIELAAGLQKLRKEAERIKDPFKNIEMIEGDIVLETEAMIDGFEHLGIILPGIPEGYHIGLDGMLHKTEETTEAIIIQFKSMIEHVLDFTRDLASGWADVFVDMLGITESITYQMQEFDNNYWENALQNAQETYDAKKSILEQQLEDAAGYYDELEEKLTDDYEKRKQWIEANVKDEEKKQEMLLNLEQKHQADLEKARTDQLQKEQDLQNSLVELEENHQVESERIRAEEDAAREQHAIDEEERQNTLWNKVKGIFGDAIESMLKSWTTDFIQKILLDIVDVASSLVKDLGGAFKKVKTDAADTGTKVSSELGGIAGIISGIGKGIASLITSLAKAIASAATTLAAAAPAIAVVLAMVLATIFALKLISSLFKKTAESNTMEAILKDISYIQLAALLDKVDSVNYHLAEMFPKFDYGNKQLALILGVAKKIRDNTKGILSTLNKKGTIYVDVFRSAIIEKLGVGLKEPLKEISKAEAIREKIAILDVNLKSAMKELHKRLETATGEERKELEEAIARIGLKAQKQRNEFLKQLEAIEKAEKDGVTKTENFFVSLGSKITGGLGDLGKKFSGDKGKIPEAATGAIVTSPQLVTVAEAGPEAIIPLTKPSAIQGMIGGQSIVNNNRITLNISAMDAIGVREFMRTKGLPEIIEAISVNYRGSKTRLKEAQRI